jgi:TonB family protein
MKKILVIDYDQSALVSLQGILTKEGYQVVTAGDGQAGWDKYNKESPDLVLMEAMLPKVHGFELCQRITSERNSQATVFMMTGVYKDRVYRTEALRTYGAAEYFEKPLKMAELLASVEAVLGKPEPKPVEPTPVEAKPAAVAPPPPKPVREIRPNPVLVEPRRPEKPKPARDEFALPADLDMLSKEIRKPTPAHHEARAETRLESLADEILKTVIAEPAPHKAVAEKPKDHNGNGHESADIDEFLKSALAGFDLSQEKVKVPKTAPLPPPPQPTAKPRPMPPPPAAAVAAERPVEKPKPTPQPPIVVKPMPAPQPPIVEKPKAAPTPPPQDMFSQPVETAPSVTLTPGDPGSDASPFFTPEKAKPAPARPRDVAPAPVPPRPVERPKVQPLPPPPAAAAPAPKPHKAVVKAEVKPVPTVMFTEPIEAKPKKSFSPIIAAGIGVAVLAVAGFIVLRTKKPAATVDDGLQSPQTVVQSSVPEKTVEEPPAAVPKAKPQTPRPKVVTQTKVADIGPSSEDAILLPSQPMTVPAASLNQSAAADDKTSNAAGSAAAQADPPPVKTEENPGQTAATETGTTVDPGTTAAAPPVTPPAAPVKEGDLVDLASVDEQPRTLKSVEPIYPSAAQRMGVTGSITVNALIDETGNVIDTGILKGMKDDRGLGKAAESAVRKWKFQPARKGGVNVKVWKAFVIAFKAGENAARMIE